MIAGASFAGLAAARRVRGRVLLLDRVPLGDGVTSACAAPVAIVETMGAAAAIQEVHDRLVLHTPGRSTTWALPEPFCTFDYNRFCRLAFAATTAEFRCASVVGRDGPAVFTGARETSARFLIDATGWRAALGPGPGRRPVPVRSAQAARRPPPGRLVAFGIESEVAAGLEPGLHFYFLPEVRDGYAWAFPCGGVARFGVLSYFGRTKLYPGLAHFMGRFGLRPGPLHGGYLASGFHDPVSGGVFLVGDAAGQCLPLTGEGIRTAVLGGLRAGELLQDVLDGRRSFEDAAAAYRAFVGGARRAYRALLWGNLALLALPLRLTGIAAHYLSRPGPLRTFMRHYLGRSSAGLQP